MKKDKRNSILFNMLIELRDGGNGHHTISDVYDWILENFNEEETIKTEGEMIARAISNAPSNSLVHKTYRLGFKACFLWLQAPQIAMNQERYKNALEYKEHPKEGSFPGFCITETEYDAKLRIAAGLDNHNGRLK